LVVYVLLANPMDGTAHLSASVSLAPTAPIGACKEHLKLVCACDEASERWRTRLHLAMLLGFAGNEGLDELVRLKNDFWTAHSRLEAHDDSCEICRSAGFKYGE
jgi:hypothetical protein